MMHALKRDQRPLASLLLRVCHVLLGLVALLSCGPSSTGNDDDSAGTVIGMLVVRDYYTPNAAQGTSVQWLVAGQDTSLQPAAIATSANAIVSAFGEPRRALFVGFSTVTLRLSLVDVAARRVEHERLLTLPLSVRDTKDSSVRWSVLPNTGAGVQVLDSLGVALLSANTGAFQTPGILALDLRTLVPLWFWPGRDPSAFGVLSGKRGREAWVAVKHLSEGGVVGGSVLRIDFNDQLLRDSISLPSSRLSSTFAYSVADVPGTDATVFALTPQTIYRCSMQTRSCAPTMIPSTGALVALPEQSRWLQMVANARARAPGDARLRIVRADGSVERVIDIPEATAALPGGIFGDVTPDGRRAYLTFGADPLSAPRGDRGTVLILDLETLRREWHGTLRTDSLVPAGIVSRKP